MYVFGIVSSVLDINRISKLFFLDEAVFTERVTVANDAVCEISIQFINLALYGLKMYLLGGEPYVRGFEQKYTQNLRKINSDIIFQGFKQ